VRCAWVIPSGLALAPVTESGARNSVVPEVECAPETSLSVAFVTTEKVYDVPGVNPEIVNDVSPAPGWFAIVHRGVHVTV
jgi:hypothetical protein